MAATRAEHLQDAAIGVDLAETGRRRKRIIAEHARATLLSRLEDFLEGHTRGADLGLRLRGEQLAAGVRFVRLVRESQHDLSSAIRRTRAPARWPTRRTSGS